VIHPTVFRTAEMTESDETNAALAMAEETREACLSFIGLPAVPAGVLTLTSLTRLDLGHNHISMLPAAIGALAR
jgi:Leucine-rich repeat (LRR) protein